MPTEQQENGSTSETEAQEQQDQQQQATGETPGNGEQQQVVINDETRLPETHPLVKSLGTLRSEIAAQKTELSEARAQAAKASKLETELAARPTQEALDTLQTRYDRLEAFLQAAGGDIAKALDSRSFTRDLFESDKDIEEIVQDWNAANPSATSKALGSAAATPAKKGPSMNDILRAAAK